MAKLAALVVATLLAIQSAATADADERWSERSLNNATPIALPRNGPLTEPEMEIARIAWQYFENNYQPDTGLTNAAHNYPSTTLWDTASYLAGLVAAHRFGLVDEGETHERLDRLLSVLENLKLFRDECPNKVYNTLTVLPSDYLNNPGEIGCSAIDIGRLLIWLRIVQQRYPEFEGPAEQVVGRWNFCGLVQEPGVMFGTALTERGAVLYLQEGRLGYEEYAAKGFQLWGFDTSKAAEPEPYETIWLYGVEIAYDSRDPRVLGAHNYVVVESYALDGLEFGWPDLSSDGPIEQWLPRFAQNIYEAQVRRYEATDILTARTEHQIEELPYFVYDTIFTNGRPFGTMTERGEFVPRYAAVALKGALGLWALWETEYTDRLFQAIVGQYDLERGFYEGIYEDGRGPINVWTANNNGIMLETLLFKADGPILQPVTAPSGWAEGIDEATRRAHCLPR